MSVVSLKDIVAGATAVGLSPAEPAADDAPLVEHQATTVSAGYVNDAMTPLGILLGAGIGIGTAYLVTKKR